MVHDPESKTNRAEGYPAARFVCMITGAERHGVRSGCFSQFDGSYKALLMLHRTRDLLIRQRTQLINALRADPIRGLHQG